MRIRFTALVALLGVWALVAQPTAQQAAQGPDFSKIDAIVRQEMQQAQTPGAAVAAVYGDRIVYSRGFGVANVETGEAVRPEMVFRLGSTTKMFTAAAVVLLAEQGKLKLSDPIGTHIKGLTPNLARLTADQLLSHQSGILDEAPMFGSHDDEALKREVAGWTDTRFFAEPGQVYSYSNPGYWLAGLLAETVGAQPFADQVAKTVFEPLGMTRSTFRPTLAMTFPLAQGHDLVNNTPRIIRPAANNSASWPAGSIYSNVMDLSKWMMAFVSGGLVDGQRVLPAAVFETMTTPRVKIPGSLQRYGYGVQVGDVWGGAQVVEHGGSRSGYGSVIRMVPERKFGVVVLANRTGVSLTRTANAVMEAVLGPQGRRGDTVLIGTPLTAAQQKAVLGVYSQGTRQMEIVAAADGLALRQGGRDTALKFQGALAGGGEFYLMAGTTRYVVVTDAAGAPLFLHSGGRSWRKVK